MAARHKLLPARTRCGRGSTNGCMLQGGAKRASSQCVRCGVATVGPGVPWRRHGVRMALAHALQQLKHALTRFTGGARGLLPLPVACCRGVRPALGRRGRGCSLLRAGPRPGLDRSPTRIRGSALGSRIHGGGRSGSRCSRSLGLGSARLGRNALAMSTLHQQGTHAAGELLDLHVAVAVHVQEAKHDAQARVVLCRVGRTGGLAQKSIRIGTCGAAAAVPCASRAAQASDAHPLAADPSYKAPSAVPPCQAGHCCQCPSCAEESKGVGRLALLWLAPLGRDDDRVRACTGGTYRPF